jgi:DNA-3-methyladenine glycosylase II
MRGCRGKILQRRSDPFVSLARSIVGQQISVKAASSIWQRLLLVAPVMVPNTIVRLDEATLRGCGLSGRKAAYLGDLATHFLTGSIRPELWKDLDDEDVIGQLVAVKGVGRWTAEMFLIFHLQRPDILPLADVGLRRAMNLHYNNGRPLSDGKIRRISALWEPWRTVATWYLWRSLDPA